MTLTSEAAASKSCCDFTSVQSNPSYAVQAFENELRKHLATERDVAAIVPLSNIGCLCVETAPLKASLRAEAAAWKTQFAKNLHKQGFTDLSVRLSALCVLTACKAESRLDIQDA